METSKRFSDLLIHLKRTIDMVDSLEAQSSLNNSYSLELDESENRLLFIPVMPSAAILDGVMYQKLFKTISLSAYPFLTFLKQASPLIIPLHNRPIATSRAFSFPYMLGTPERISGVTLQELMGRVKNQTIPLMTNLSIDMSKINFIAISGRSGSGKSFLAKLILYLISVFADIWVVDPKLDEPTDTARKLGLRCLNPSKESSSDAFLQDVSSLFAEALKIIQQRQEQQLSDRSIVFKPLYIFVDELAGLKQITDSKKVRDQFDSLLNIVALMGRGVSVRLILISQSWDSATTVSTATRQQISLAISLGAQNSATLQYLFPDLVGSGTDGIIIPENGKAGSGIIQITDNVHAPNVMPFLSPTYLD